MQICKHLLSQKENTICIYYIYMYISVDNFTDCSDHLKHQLKEKSIFKTHLQCNRCYFFFRATFQISLHFWKHSTMGLYSSVKQTCQTWIRFSYRILRRTVRNHYNLFFRINECYYKHFDCVEWHSLNKKKNRKWLLTAE